MASLSRRGRYRTLKYAGTSLNYLLFAVVDHTFTYFSSKFTSYISPVILYNGNLFDTRCNSDNPNQLYAKEGSDQPLTGCIKGLLSIGAIELDGRRTMESIAQ